MRKHGRTHLIIDRATGHYFRDVDGKPQPTADVIAKADLYHPLDVAEVGLSWFWASFQPMLISSRESTASEFKRIWGRIGGGSSSDKKKLSSKMNGSVVKRRFNMKGTV